MACGRAGPMRVLHVINTAEVGGGGEHLRLLTRGLAPSGVASTVITGRDGPTSQRLREAGVSVTVLGGLGPARVVPLMRLLRETRPDVLHLHGSRAGLFGAVAARQAGVGPAIYTAHAFSFHRLGPPGTRWLFAGLERLTCAWVDRVICLTHADLAAAARSGIAVRHFAVVPNGIDLAQFDGVPDCRTAFGFSPLTPVVGMVARLVPQKDPLTFVRMARAVAEAARHVRFLIVGDGPLRGQVETAVRELGLADRVTLTGFREDVPSLLRSMNVVVLPSRWEGLPLVVLEAMAASRPLVATRLPSVAEIIVDGDTGRLAPIGDAGRLAHAVVGLLTDPAAAAAMGARGRRRVEEAFSLGRMIDGTLDVYRAALAARRTPAS